VFRSHTDSLSLHDYDTHTNTKEDVASSEGEFRDDEEEEERDKDSVSEEDILSQVGPFQVPQHHEIIPVSILDGKLALAVTGLSHVPILTRP